MNATDHNLSDLDIHTTELTAQCGRAVQLKLLGKVSNECTSARWRGIVFHEALELYHGVPGYTPDYIALAAITNAQDKLKRDGERLSPAAKLGTDELKAETAELIEHYHARFGAYFATCKMIGTELPVRLTLDVDGQPANIASHIDLLYRTPEDLLVIDDWKSADKAPTREYLDRNLQLGVYGLIAMHGQVLIGSTLRPDGTREGGQWVSFNEQAEAWWVHLNHLWPAGRKSTVIDDAGQKLEHVKGDLKPTRMIRRPCIVTDEQALIDELALRVRMRRADLWPMNPEAVRCRTCDSNHWCPNWAKEPTNE